MFGYVKDKARGYIVTLRFSLLSIFITLFAVMSILMFSVFYSHMSGILLQAGFALMEKDSYAILHELDLQLRPVASASELSATSIREKIINPNDPQEVT